MNRQTPKSSLRLVTNDFGNEVFSQNQGIDPKWERQIKNLSASMAFLLDASEDNRLATMIGHGDEASTEEGIRTWPTPRYLEYSNLRSAKRLNRACDDLITLDYRAFDDDFDPFSKDASNSAIKKFSKRLKGYVLQYANDIVIPHLENKLKALPRPDEYDIEVSEDGEKIWIQYPSAIEENNEYLQSSILIELGGRNVIGLLAFGLKLFTKSF